MNNNTDVHSQFPRGPQNPVEFHSLMPSPYQGTEFVLHNPQDDSLKLTNPTDPLLENGNRKRLSSAVNVYEHGKVKTKKNVSMLGSGFPGKEDSTGAHVVREYKCDQCDKSFSKSSNLTQHKRIHTNERPFKCDVPGCGKAFRQSGNLTKHKRSHEHEHLRWKRNSSQKPFKCTHEGCNKSFTAKSSLQIHQRTHTGEKPYPCPVEGCNEAFHHRSGLLQHEKKHAASNDDTYICNHNMCSKQFHDEASFRQHLASYAGPIQDENILLRAQLNKVIELFKKGDPSGTGNAIKMPRNNSLSESGSNDFINNVNILGISQSLNSSSMSNSGATTVGNGLMNIGLGDETIYNGLKTPSNASKARQFQDLVQESEDLLTSLNPITSSVKKEKSKRKESFKQELQSPLLTSSSSKTQDLRSRNGKDNVSNSSIPSGLKNMNLAPSFQLPNNIEVSGSGTPHFFVGPDLSSHPKTPILSQIYAQQQELSNPQNPNILSAFNFPFWTQQPAANYLKQNYVNGTKSGLNYMADTPSNKQSRLNPSNTKRQNNSNSLRRRNTASLNEDGQSLSTSKENANRKKVALRQNSATGCGDLEFDSIHHMDESSGKQTTRKGASKDNNKQLPNFSGINGSFSLDFDQHITSPPSPIPRLSFENYDDNFDVDTANFLHSPRDLRSFPQLLSPNLEYNFTFQPGMSLGANDRDKK
jgi:hypothetical protein